VQQGEPAGIVLLHANAKRFDLLVIGSHRRLGWERFRLGSVAERILQRAACPVLVVATPAQDERGASSGAVTRIVCPVDFTRGSTAAVATALSIVHETGGQLTLLHVLPAFPSPNASRVHGNVGTPKNRQRVIERAHRRMEAALPPDVGESTTVQTRVAVGKPADVIARVATAVEADLVIVGVTARGALGRRLIGSTAARVIGRTGSAVLTVPRLPNTRFRRPRPRTADVRRSKRGPHPHVTRYP
jgi:nucleotide-binding universal stress UspA family protein